MKKKKTDWGGMLMVLFFLLIGGACGLLILDYMDAAGVEDFGSFLLYFGLLLLALYAVMYLQIILHEGGHLIFGLLTGYGFSSFRVGSLMLQKTEEGLRFRRMSLAGTGGQCLMTPPALQNGTMPFVLYNLGGVLMNLLTALVFLLLSLLCLGTALCAVLRMGAVVGLGYALDNLSLMNNSLTDITELGKLGGLDILNLSGNQISDLQALMNSPPPSSAA